MPMNKALFYCQHHFGIGHYIRTVSISETLVRSGWRVVILSGSEPPRGIPLSREIILIPLEPLHLSGQNSQLETNQGKKPDQRFFAQRAKAIGATLADFKPDWFITEHFPFGRWRLHAELDPIMNQLKTLRKHNLLRVGCSIRDFIGGKQLNVNQLASLKSYLQQFYDGIFIHADKRHVDFSENYSNGNYKFSNLQYTGYVKESSIPQFSEVYSLSRLRKMKEYSKRVLVASVGGGRGGVDLLSIVLKTFSKPEFSSSWIVHIITGPRIEKQDWKDLIQLGKRLPHILISKTVPRLLPYLSEADLSISHCGYNTAVSVASSGCRAIFIPIQWEFIEQAWRANMFASHGIGKVMMPEDLSISTLSECVRSIMSQKMLNHLEKIDTNGAERMPVLLSNNFGNQF